jgi:hypothetical protein
LFDKDDSGCCTTTGFTAITNIDASYTDYGDIGEDGNLAVDSFA